MPNAPNPWDWKRTLGAREVANKVREALGTSFGRVASHRPYVKLLPEWIQEFFGEDTSGFLANLVSETAPERELNESFRNPRLSQLDCEHGMFIEGKCLHCGAEKDALPFSPEDVLRLRMLQAGVDVDVLAERLKAHPEEAEQVVDEVVAGVRRMSERLRREKEGGSNGG